MGAFIGSDRYRLGHSPVKLRRLLQLGSMYGSHGKQFMVRAVPLGPLFFEKKWGGKQRIVRECVGSGRCLRLGGNVRPLARCPLDGKGTRV